MPGSGIAAPVANHPFPFLPMTVQAVAMLVAPTAVSKESRLEHTMPKGQGEATICCPKHVGTTVQAFRYNPPL